jgi:hypothetical protein
MTSAVTDERKATGLLGHDMGLARWLAILVLVTLLSLSSVLHNATPRHPHFWDAVPASIVLIGFIPLFVRARFSFGYVAGVSFYGMIAGYFWLSYFTKLDYDVTLARWSALGSLLLFLLPVLFQTRPLPTALKWSPATMDRFVLGLLGLAVVVLALSATYGFALVGLERSETLRSSFVRPTLLNYAIGAITSAVLPFAFAYLAWQRRYGLAAVAILLIWAYYPVALNKSVLFGGLWLPYVFVMFRLFEPKRAAIYTLSIPMIPGIIAYGLMLSGWLSMDSASGHAAQFVIGMVNVRMFGYPTFALDLYSDFFASHPVTHYCQIAIIRAIHGCPYPFQLGTVMAEAYHLGSFNGSLFATEGIASVGPLWAPVSALVCGLIVSLGNSASTRLPPAVVATSAGLAVQQALLNAPLSVSLLTNGVLMLWLLWAITPPASLEQRN